LPSFPTRRSSDLQPQHKKDNLERLSAEVAKVQVINNAFHAVDIVAVGRWRLQREHLSRCNLFDCKAGTRKGHSSIRFGFDPNLHALIVIIADIDAGYLTILPCLLPPRYKSVHVEFFSQRR